MADLARRSPIGTGAAGTTEEPLARAVGIEIRELPFRAQALLRMSPGEDALRGVSRALGVDVPLAPNLLGQGRASAGRMAIWLGPDEWLIVDETDAAAFESELRDAGAPHDGSVVDVSAHRTILELDGARARDVLAAG